MTLKPRALTPGSGFFSSSLTSSCADRDKHGCGAMLPSAGSAPVSPSFQRVQRVGPAADHRTDAADKRLALARIQPQRLQYRGQCRKSDNHAISTSMDHRHRIQRRAVGIQRERISSQSFSRSHQQPCRHAILELDSVSARPSPFFIRDARLQSFFKPLPCSIAVLSVT